MTTASSRVRPARRTSRLFLTLGVACVLLGLLGHALGRGWL